MAYGNVVGYEETPIPGAYSFADKTGQKWTLSGAPAEDLKRRLDESAALMPQPTAELTAAQRVAAMNTQAGAEASRLDAPPADLAAQEARLDARAAQQTPPQAPGQPAAAARGAAPQYVQTASGPGGTIIETRVGADLSNPQPGDIRVTTPARAGSKGGLDLRSETRQGVQELDPEFMASLDENRAAQAKALEARQAAEVEQAEQNAEHASELRRIAINQEREAQAQEVEVSKQVGELQKKYDAAEKAVASSKIDTSATWMESLAVGLGTVAALHNKTGNDALNIVQRQINRRIAAQEHEINIKRETKNDFARMLEVTKGDRRLARAALDAAYTKKAAAVFEARSATAGDKLLKATHQQQALQFAEANMLKKRAMENEARGQITQSYVNRPAVAASAGGARLPTVAELASLQGIGLKGEEKDGKGAGGEAGAAATQRAQGVDAAERALDRFEVASGKAGTVLTTGALGSPESQDLGSQAEFIAPILGRAFEGNAPNESVMDAITSGLQSSDPGKRNAAVKAARALLQDIKRSQGPKP